jgi:hypothetical protein
MKYTLEQFKANVIQWSTDREIIKHGNVDGQLRKVEEESDETIDAICAGCSTSIADGVGDTAVTLINIDAVQKSNTDFTLIELNEFSMGEPDKLKALGLMCLVKFEARYTSEDYLASWELLQKAAYHLNHDFMGCCELAWNEIKDRKGRFCKETMSFVKES